jgi:hypothetical protein
MYRISSVWWTRNPSVGCIMRNGVVPPGWTRIWEQMSAEGEQQEESLYLIRHRQVVLLLQSVRVLLPANRALDGPLSMRRNFTNRRMRLISRASLSHSFEHAAIDRAQEIPSPVSPPSPMKRTSSSLKRLYALSSIIAGLTVDSEQSCNNSSHRARHL